jgi:hypothetical protein
MQLCIDRTAVSNLEITVDCAHFKPKPYIIRVQVSKLQMQVLCAFLIS